MALCRTIGVEEEYQIVDPRTGELVSHVTQLLGSKKAAAGLDLKPELYQSVVEIGTPVCESIEEVSEELTRLRRQVAELAAAHGLRIAAAATHPFSDWKSQDIYPDPRYANLVEDLQDVARSCLIFGLHVHVGIEDRDEAIHLMNVARYFLPHVLALTVNSPFWLGRPSGLKSTRSKIFERFPRTGIPGYWSSYAEYQRYIDLLMKTGCIHDRKMVWWDVRVHPVFDTLEFRVCDLPTRVEDSVAIAALFQALVKQLSMLFEHNLSFRTYRRALISENKWRAVRYGLDGKMIDFGKEREVLCRDLIHELLQFVQPAARELGTRSALRPIERILEEGTGADRQLRVYDETGDLREVVRDLIEQTMTGIDWQEPTGGDDATSG